MSGTDVVVRSFGIDEDDDASFEVHRLADCRHPRYLHIAEGKSDTVFGVRFTVDRIVPTKNGIPPQVDLSFHVK